MKIKWIKPNGLEINTNDLPDTISYAIELGWRPYDPDEEPQEPIQEENSLEASIGLCETKEELKTLLRESGLSVDMRGSLDKVKAKALEVI